VEGGIVKFRVFILVAASALGGCARFQPTAPAIKPSDYTPTGFAQSFTMKDSSIHYDASIMRPGATREQITSAFGEPNESGKTDAGLIEEVYAFNPDGTKFVNPSVRPRNVALGFLTMGTSLAVRQARLALTEKKLTLYHVVYSADNKVTSVTEEKLSGPTSAPPPQSESNVVE
jgi:hypothetical protein